MNKSLYSLMLMDDVVKEVDKLALRAGTSRSNLVNERLAEYVSVSTPEKQIDSIFRSMEELLSRTTELVPSRSTASSGAWRSSSAAPRSWCRWWCQTS